ncbi:hypothetical protein CPB83DRAFT_884052 [Crepidotus variabilis]|uniref:Uncharacterized protein n=1 Tax=Crepidotus variabilis TaxID=179855 RepID=A0A9P6JPF4_9AGAR|nr:hypothetical protein CPB83DRAFT_884052 [Crepidotus variabilis]
MVHIKTYITIVFCFWLSMVAAAPTYERRSSTSDELNTLVARGRRKAYIRPFAPIVRRGGEIYGQVWKAVTGGDQKPPADAKPDSESESSGLCTRDTSGKKMKANKCSM